MITDENGEIVWSASYLPFGEAGITSSAVGNEFRFPGQYYDAETGLHYNYFRYYDPDTGRYLTPDPIGLAGGMNPYAYVDNDPTNWIDPFGLTELIYSLTMFGDQDAGFLNFSTKIRNDWKAETAKSKIESAVAQLQWRGSRGNLSGVAGLYHWHGELSGGMINIYSLGAIEGSAKIAAYEGKAIGFLKLGSIFIKPYLNGTLGSLGVEDKLGLQGIKAGLHALIGIAVGLEWGFVEEIKCE